VSFPLTLTFKNEAELVHFAGSLSLLVQAGDVITLGGDLGAGKSTFARGLIRALAQDPQLDVPSPTYTLMQYYETARLSVVHADLYRLKSVDELDELGWEEGSAGALLLIEWPEKITHLLEGDRLHLELAIDHRHGPSFRRLVITPIAGFEARFARFLALNAFLEHTGYGEAERHFMQGDASSRSYERLTHGPRHVVLMNAPPKPDGPPIKNGQSYSKIVHLAENMLPFVAFSNALNEAGLSAPRIKAADIAQGFLIIEDLGDKGVTARGRAIMDRYLHAVSVLCLLHERPRPVVLSAMQANYSVPHFDYEAMLTEIELLLEWYFPFKNISLPFSEKRGFIKAWEPLLKEEASRHETWVLRDYHSPNLLWLPERTGVQKIGVIDFQDAMIGPASYDLVSLTQDARIDMSEEEEEELVRAYVVFRAQRGGEQGGNGFDMEDFMRSYAIMGAQRAAKILGIFARLAKRDNKPQYLAHMPRIYSYLWRNLAHPALHEVADWCKKHLPAS
jgi:N-acetylmuramate 1-kinase